jgi:hypothetical protein
MYGCYIAKQCKLPTGQDGCSGEYRQLPCIGMDGYLAVDFQISTRMGSISQKKE